MFMNYRKIFREWLRWKDAGKTLILSKFLIVKSKNCLGWGQNIFLQNKDLLENIPKQEIKVNRSENITLTLVKGMIYLKNKGIWLPKKDKCGSWHKIPDASPNLRKMQVKGENVKSVQSSIHI